MRLLRCMVAVFLLTWLGSGCSPASDDPQRASTMTILSGGDGIDAMRLYNPKFLLWLPLVERFGDEIRPRLAKSWEHSVDYRTWTFHLRDDVRWHDGVPVSAHDVAFSVELFAHPDVLFGTRAWALASTSVPDDHTITMDFTRPVDPRSGWLIFFPKHLLAHLDPADFYEWDFWTEPVGNGPYRFVRLVPKTVLELEANPDFYAGESQIKRVVVKFGALNPVIELTSGGADVSSLLLTTDLVKLKADPEYVIYYAYDWSMLHIIYWNQRHPFLADMTVRRALSHAIDRRELARMLMLPDEMPLIGGLSDWTLADQPYTHAGWDQGPAFEPDTANRLLDEAGWIDADGNGIRERAGLEARFILMAPTGGGFLGEAPALLIQHHLQSVGVATEILPMQQSLVRAAIRSGDFDAALAWEDQEPDDILGAWFGDPSPLAYDAPEFVQLLEALRAEPDSEARNRLYARTNEILRRDMPVTFLFPSAENFVAHRRIRGFRPDASAFLSHSDELWIEEGL